MDKCILTEDTTNKKWYFLSGQWFSSSEGDGLLSREISASNESGSTYLPITHYRVSVYTGNRRGAGTNAKVSIVVFGENGDSGPRVLENASNNFERGQTDIFGFEAVDLGTITSIRIGHDNSGFGPGWFLDKVVVKSEILQREWNFHANRWLATDEEDGQIIIDIAASEDAREADPFVTYKISVFTGDRRGAGTDANVFIELTGEDGKTSGRQKLDNSQNNFERGKEDIFGIETVSLGKLQKIDIGHDNSGFAAGWFLDKVGIQDLSSNQIYYFVCGRWLATNEEDGAIIREIVARDADGASSLATKQYGITVYTGDRDGAGTSAKVQITLCGENGQTGPHIIDNSFDRSSEIQFQIEAVDLGNIRKIRIEHDNSGLAPGWFLEKVKIQQVDDESKVWYCLCGRWLASDEEDGAISRELPAGSEDGQASLPIVDYHIRVITGDRNGAGTNANVFIEVFGANGNSGVHKLDNARDNFERNKSEVFQISYVDLGDIQRIRIGHDGKGWGAGWFLDKVIIETGEGVTKYFLCGRWLAADEDDGQIVRELLPAPEDKQTYSKLVDYKITVITGDRRGSGTDANVFIYLYGEGSTPAFTLDSPQNNFERNKTDVFIVRAPDLGDLTKIRIGHDASGFGSDWFLDKVMIESESPKVGHKKYFFLCGKWLSSKKDEGQIIREIAASDADGHSYAPMVRYKVEVQTGTRRGSGTNASVSICITGDKGDTGNLTLDTNSDNFERGKLDVFGVDAVDLGELIKIRIGHDDSGFFAGWFLESVRITNESNGKSYFFFCGRWLDTKEDDGQIVRELAACDSHGKVSLPEVRYHVTVQTGDRRGAGTDANVFIELFGEHGSTGTLKSINIGHDNSGFGSGWFLEKATVRNTITGAEYYFLCGRWLATDEDDGAINRVLTPSNQDGRASVPLVDYLVTVHTGDRRGAGTVGKSGTQWLAPDDNNLFRRKKISSFNLTIPDLGVIQTITIGHDDKSWGSAWFLDKVVIRNNQSGQETFFLCGKWLASDAGDGQIVRTLASMENGQASLPIVDYKVTVITGDRFGAGTDANVFITLFGDNGDSGAVNLDSSGNNFERKQTDYFGVQVPDLGNISKIRIGHDDSGLNAAWFLDKVIVENPISKKKWFFLCGKWLDKSSGDRVIQRDIVATNEDGVASLPLVLFSVQILTGTLRGAGTDANVFVTIEGDKGDSGKIQLAGASNLKEDLLILLDYISSILVKFHAYYTIGHDGKGWLSAWYVEHIKIRNEQSGVEFTFPCARWLDEKSEDGKISISLLPSALSGEVSSCVSWKVVVTTGDVRNAGCSANVFINLFDGDKESGKLSLQGENDSFERGKTDTFFVETSKLSNLTKIRIGHDGGGSWTSLYGAAWYLSTVSLTNCNSNKTYSFTFNEWIQKKNLVVELFPTSIV